MAGDAASNVADRVRPPTEDLAQIDHPAEDNLWHETPDLSKDNMKKQLQSVYKGNPKEDAQAVASNAVDAHNQNLGVSSTSAGQPLGASSTSARQAGVTAGVNTALQRADDKIDDETKEEARSRAREIRAKTKAYLSKKMPEERREQTIWRLKVMTSPSMLLYAKAMSNQDTENGD